MAFKLTIKTDNAAFENDSAELVRCLDGVTEKVRRRETSGNVVDSNGNTVGSWSTSYPNEDESLIG